MFRNHAEVNSDGSQLLLPISLLSSHHRTIFTPLRKNHYPYFWWVCLILELRPDRLIMPNKGVQSAISAWVKRAWPSLLQVQRCLTIELLGTCSPARTSPTQWQTCPLGPRWPHSCLTAHRTGKGQRLLSLLCWSDAHTRCPVYPAWSPKPHFSTCILKAHSFCPANRLVQWSCQLSADLRSLPILSVRPGSVWRLPSESL